MPVYTVHEPRKLTGNPVRDAERFQFVRDGFYVWAFLLGPVWMLFRRMWLVFVLYAIAMAGIFYGLHILGMSVAVNVAIGILIALLVGFEAGSLRRFALRRWRNVGSVVGVNRDEAERRFFERHLKPWAARFFADLEAAQGARFYRAVGQLGRAGVVVAQQQGVLLVEQVQLVLLMLLQLQTKKEPKCFFSLTCYVILQWLNITY